MGRFTYDSHSHVEIEDRTLVHLQHVIGTKLRRDESFFFTWKEDRSLGKGRVSVWLHSDAHLEFKYHDSRTPQLSREWLEAPMTAANSPGGLYLVPEPQPGSATNARPQTEAIPLVG